MASTEPGATRSPVVWRELLRAARPRQWSKNLLVFAAPLLSGRFTESDVLGNAAVAFVAFTLAASAVYLVNDACDVESDRAHPTKRRRPVAAGTLSARTASWVGAILAAAALVVALISGLDLVIVIAVYLALSLLYCFALKDEPVIDIAIIAAGFLLRAIAGGAAAGIELSQWFLLAASFGSLFMAAGKRYAEILLVDEGGPAFRASLASYSASYLRFVWTVSAGLLIMTYGLWAFELGQESDGKWWYVGSMTPFVLAVLRYALDVDAGNAGEPEDLALGDRVLEVLAVLWLVSVAIAVYST
jgi:decaprenyl-phosphate phosphoribosyltransferase